MTAPLFLNRFAVLFLLASPLLVARAGEETLFNGKDLTGWEGNAEIWRVKDGVISGGSMAGNPRNEFLTLKKTYHNFILKIEYKLVGTEGFVNSGVQFHSQRMEKPANEMIGYQADIGAGWSGTLQDESRRKGPRSKPPVELVKRLEKPGDWNHYEIRTEGRHVEIFLNGEKTVDYTEADETIPQEGLIGLQIHGGNKAEVFFRNLVIEEKPQGK